MLKRSMAWYIFFVISIVFTGSCSASEKPASAVLLSVFVFSDVPFEADFNPGGEYVQFKDITPRITEYKEFKQWNPAETTSSPDKVDAIAVIANVSNERAKEVSVRFEVYEKIGPLVLHEVYGVTDVSKGKKEAVWENTPSLIKIIKVQKIEIGSKKSVKLADIDIKSLLKGKKENKKWPFEIKVVVKVNCEVCGSGSVEKAVEVLPGD